MRCSRAAGSSTIPNQPGPECRAARRCRTRRERTTTVTRRKGSSLGGLRSIACRVPAPNAALARGDDVRLDRAERVLAREPACRVARLADVGGDRRARGRRRRCAVPNVRRGTIGVGAGDAAARELIRILTEVPDDRARRADDCRRAFIRTRGRGDASRVSREPAPAFAFERRATRNAQIGTVRTQEAVAARRRRVRRRRRARRLDDGGIAAADRTIGCCSSSDCSCAVRAGSPGASAARNRGAARRASTAAGAAGPGRCTSGRWSAAGTGASRSRSDGTGRAARRASVFVASSGGKGRRAASRGKRRQDQSPSNTHLSET